MVRWQFGTGKLSGVEGGGLDVELAAAASFFVNLTSSSKPIGGE